MKRKSKAGSFIIANESSPAHSLLRGFLSGVLVAFLIMLNLYFITLSSYLLLVVGVNQISGLIGFLWIIAFLLMIYLDCKIKKWVSW